MKSLKLLPTLLLLAIPFTHAASQEIRTALVRSLSPGVVSIEGRWRHPVTGKLGKAGIAGSGFFVDEQGRVVTCYHVIDGLKEIAVRTKSGRRLKVKLIRTQMEFGRAQNINYAIPSHRVLNFLLPYYREVAAKTPSDPASHYNLGRIHDALSHHSEAESAYRKSLRLRAGADACRALGILFLTQPVNPDGKSKTAQRRENIRKAIEYLTRAIEIAPDDGKARYNLAVAHFEINEKAQARSQCDALSKLRAKRKLTQPVLGNAARLCSWSNAPF